MIRYTLKADEAYLTEWAFRVRVQDSLPYRWDRIMMVCGIFTLLVALGAALSHVLPIWGLLSLLVSGAYFLANPTLDRYFIARRLRRSPLYGQSISLTLDWDSCEESVESKSEKIDWQSFTKALRLADGFLLFAGPKKTVWLPDAAIAEGTVNEASLLLKNHVQGYAG